MLGGAGIKKARLTQYVRRGWHKKVLDRAGLEKASSTQYLRRGWHEKALFTENARQDWYKKLV